MSKKRPYMVIDEHVHLGSEVEGPLNIRRLLTSQRGAGLLDIEQKQKRTSHTNVGAAVMREYFVGAKRWDKKYLDMSLLPPLTIDDLVYYMDDVGIDKCVVLGRDYQNPWPPYTLIRVSVEHVYNCVQKYPDRFVGIAGINPYEKHCEMRIPYYIDDLGFKGVGEIYAPTGIRFDDKELMYPIYEQCVENDCTIFFHHSAGIGAGLVGRAYWNGRPTTNPETIEEVGYDFPDLRISMHSGPPGGTVAQLCKNFPNMYTQIGGWPRPHPARPEETGVGAPRIREWILYCQKNIPDKVMLSSDYPWGFPQHEMFEWIESMPELTPEFKKKAFETNVRKLYKF